MKKAESFWYPEKQLIVTRISGHVEMEDVEKWEISLLEVLNLVPDNGLFKIMVDLHGFKAMNFDVHKKFRVIVPQTLAAYGWRVGYLDMFPESKVVLTTTRGVQCFAAVHVHQDETKIKNYDTNYSRPNERFFTDPAIALRWIDQIQPQTKQYEK